MGGMSTLKRKKNDFLTRNASEKLIIVTFFSFAKMLYTLTSYFFKKLGTLPSLKRYEVLILLYI